MIVPGAVVDIAANTVYLKAFKRIDRVASDTAYSDLHCLYLLARSGWGDGAIVEIGAFHGKSTAVLALGSRAGRREKVISIDPHTAASRDAFEHTLRSVGVQDRVTPLFMTSAQASEQWRGPVRLLFIDGDHAYESVKLDIERWEGRVIDGGVIVFHDLNWKSVFRALDERILRNPAYRIEGSIGCSLVVSKGSSRNRHLIDELRVFNRLKQALRPWKGPNRDEYILRSAIGYDGLRDVAPAATPRGTEGA